MAGKSAQVQLEDILNSCYREIKTEADKAIKKQAYKTKNHLKKHSPKNSGEYADGWAVKYQDGGYVVHNIKKPGLTHLLENGHVIKNQYGEYGRAPAHPHIKEAEEQAIEELTEKIEDLVKDL